MLTVSGNLALLHVKVESGAEPEAPDGAAEAEPPMIPKMLPEGKKRGRPSTKPAGGTEQPQKRKIGQATSREQIVLKRPAAANALA